MELLQGYSHFRTGFPSRKYKNKTNLIIYVKFSCREQSRVKFHRMKLVLIFLILLAGLVLI